MRFFLDNDVDAAVAARLRKRGHTAFTAADVGIPAALDDAISVAADTRAAACMSHDRAFAKRRQQRTIGQHVWLHCEQPDAVAVVDQHIDEICGLLSRMPNVVLEVIPSQVKVHGPRWR